MSNQSIITPEMKVAEFLTAYPHLENNLVEIAPAFKNLKNTVLRKTIARMATLKQAAAIGSSRMGGIHWNRSSVIQQRLYPVRS